MFEVTVHMTGETISGKKLPPDGALEVRTIAATDEAHALAYATRCLLHTEEIVSVREVPEEEERSRPGWWTGSDGLPPPRRIDSENP